ncbi:RHS repeat-associated core domain-containing protein [Streptomyces sp. NPDC053431]|uniref:RHS repeat-associated core domain-containing protein n=1 Tax=Streptomyces sp. NPDC053431 TaxID=3365703 RepID=UPI0037CE270E
MTSRDAMEGGGRERIPPHAKPSDVIYGDSMVVDELALQFAAYAGAFKEGMDKLVTLSLMDWTGAGAEGFKSATQKLPQELESAQKYFESSGKALDSYAYKLRSVHTRLRPIIDDADEARATSKNHWKSVTDYNAAVDRKDDPLPERPPENDPGIAALQDCYARLDKLESELKTVIEAAKRQLDTAAEKAPDKPPPPKGWDKFQKGLGDFFGGAGDTMRGWYDDFDDLVRDGPDGVGLHLAGVVDGAAYAAHHPQEFAKAVVNWDEWQRNPARAAGMLTPELLLALASGGVGATRRGASVVKDAAQRLRGRAEGLRRDGSARTRTDNDPDRNTTPNEERPVDGDPIDVATGEMVMSAVDVTLPGALPVVLERHYVSGHPCGGWFGPTWAGTLDQRLEIDDAGVVYVTDGGMLLTYPVPTPGVATPPTSGPRWPLYWDGKPDGAFRIVVPERNRTLHFSPLPVSGRELALTAITDRTGDGDRIDIAYDAQGAPTEITHSGGYRIAVDTDPQLLRITALRLLHGEEREHSTTLISYAYDAAGNLAEILNSSGKALRYRYDADHRVTSWTDRNGATYGYVYDHRGRVLRGIGPDGILSGRMHYDTAARTSRYTDSQGNTSVYVRNEAYKIVAYTDPLGNTTRTEWDEDNRHPVAVTDPLGRTTRYRYDDQGRLIAVERPDGTVSATVYDERGLPLETREPGGAVWFHTYDARGSHTSTTDPGGAVTHYGYNEAGHLTSVTDPLGRTTRITTDAAGLPVETTDPLGRTLHMRRGPHGQVVAVTDALGRTTRHGWTIEGMPAWREGPDGTREVWQWDTEGNLVLHTDEAGNTTTYTYTYFDQPATRTDPDGAHYVFAYDTELRLTGVTNPQGRTWRYTYDAAGRLVAETDFNGATRTYERDPAGRLTAQTNALGQTLRFTLDALGRMVSQRDETTGDVTTYAYDASGALLRAANADTELIREHDAVGRVIAETVNGRVSAYAYDAMGRRTRRTTPSGARSEWAHDAAGRPTGLTSGEGSIAFAYDAAGRETERRIGDATSLAQSWDGNDRLTAQTLTTRHETEAERILQQRTYAYRPDGYLTEIRELTTGTRRFTLDPMGRVTGVRAHGWSEKYAYDRAGNQTHADAPHHPTTGDRSYEGAVIRRAGRTTYEHDAAGRLVRRTRKLLNGQTRSWTYTWNAENRLTGATTPDGEEWTYAYDPLGRRVSKTGPDGTALTFTWDGTCLAEQVAADGTATTWDYAPGTDRPVSQSIRRTSELAPKAGASLLDLADTTPQSAFDARFLAIVTDLVGTPVELVTADGTLAWQSRTTLWGTPFPGAGDGADCPLRFPGQYADEETGLHYNYFRHYDPETARYTTPDPLGLVPAPNAVAYVRNPHSWSDRLGLAGEPEWANPEDINFSQRTVSPNDYVEKMRSGEWDWQRPGTALKVMEVDGQLVSYDNRRLDAAREVGRPVIIERVDPNAVHPDSTTGRTWAEQFRRRMNSSRNRNELGEPVPPTGLQERPQHVRNGKCKKKR